MLSKTVIRTATNKTFIFNEIFCFFCFLSSPIRQLRMNLIIFCRLFNTLLCSVELCDLSGKKIVNLPSYAIVHKGYPCSRERKIRCPWTDMAFALRNPYKYLNRGEERIKLFNRQCPWDIINLRCRYLVYLKDDEIQFRKDNRFRKVQYKIYFVQYKFNHFF